MEEHDESILANFKIHPEFSEFNAYINRSYLNERCERAIEHLRLMKKIPSEEG